MTVKTPSTRPGRRKRRGAVSRYDFSRPTTLAREQSRALEVGFEGFARQFSTTLLTRLRQTCTVVLTGVMARSYEDQHADLPPLGAFLTFRIEAGGESGLVVLSADTTFTALDHLLGGRGRIDAAAAASEEREVTDIERRLIESLAGRLLADLATSFVGTVPMAPVLSDVEQTPQFVTVAANADVVLIATFAVALGEDAEPQEMVVLLPLAPVVARLAESTSGTEGTDEQRRAAAQAADVLSRTVPDIPIDVSARMTPMALPVQAVSTLAVGDVLHLPHPTARPLDVVTNDVVLARAVPGTSGTRLACLVVNPDEETR